MNYYKKYLKYKSKYLGLKVQSGGNLEKYRQMMDVSKNAIKWFKKEEDLNTNSPMVTSINENEAVIVFDDAGNYMRDSFNTFKNSVIRGFEDIKRKNIKRDIIHPGNTEHARNPNIVVKRYASETQKLAEASGSLIFTLYFGNIKKVAVDVYGLYIDRGNNYIYIMYEVLKEDFLSILCKGIFNLENFKQTVDEEFIKELIKNSIPIANTEVTFMESYIDLLCKDVKDSFKPGEKNYFLMTDMKTDNIMTSIDGSIKLVDLDDGRFIGVNKNIYDLNTPLSVLYDKLSAFFTCKKRRADNRIMPIWHKDFNEEILKMNKYLQEKIIKVIDEHIKKNEFDKNIINNRLKTENDSLWLLEHD
jgi:serine/threonine protein kinase